MRLLIRTMIFLIATYSQVCISQTTIWSEDFDGNGGSGSNWGTLNQDIGSQGMTANLWYISCQENGNSAGICGSGCGSDNSLHLGSSSIGDLGAAYDASSLCLPGCFFCDFGFCSDVTTNKRSFSLNINTISQTNLTLNFNYIENGQGASDGCVVEYSVDGGTTWTQLGDPAKTVICGSGQGMWTAQSYILPIACEGISNLRIAYRWQNNADGIGTDPSFAVDDITITTPTPLPIELFSFYGKVSYNNNQINWATASELNNDYFQLEKSLDGLFWKVIAQIKGAGNSQENIWYQFEDESNSQESLYRLKQVDFNGHYSYSQIISLSRESDKLVDIYPIPATHEITVQLKTNERLKKTLELKNIEGRIVLQTDLLTKKTTLSLSSIDSGIYILLIKQKNRIIYREKILKQ